MNYKKGISPVVAISLLLIVSVVAVVGYQGWYQGYQSQLTTDVESRSTSSGNINVEYISSDGIVYIKNTGNDNVSMDKLEISGVDCDLNRNLTPGVNQFDISSCLGTGSNDVVIVTDSGIIERELYVKEFNGSSSGSSSICASLNGGEWVEVPGNSALGTTDFCVMKYEPRFINFTGKVQDGTWHVWRYDLSTGDKSINSTFTPEPITYITQIEARTSCTNLGTGYHLITNAEWTTIARNAENVSSNWNSGIVGTGSMFRGHNDGAPLYSIDISNLNDYWDQTGDTDPSIEKRVLILNNSEIIWDLGGNINEWTNDTCTQNSPWYTSGWVEWDHLNLAGAGQEKDLAGPLGPYTSAHGMGRYLGCGANGNAFSRGGYFNYDAIGGPFTLNMWRAPSDRHSGLGFRCAYTP